MSRAHWRVNLKYGRLFEPICLQIQTRRRATDFTLQGGRVEGEARAFGEGVGGCARYSIPRGRPSPETRQGSFPTLPIREGKVVGRYPYCVNSQWR